MRELLIATAAGIIAAATLVLVPTAHADPNRCYKLPANLIQMCLGDEAKANLPVDGPNAVWPNGCTGYQVNCYPRGVDPAKLPPPPPTPCQLGDCRVPAYNGF